MSAKRILIISDPMDLHARAVGYAIRAKGHLCEELYFPDFPTLATITLKVSNQNGDFDPVVRHVLSDFDFTNHKFDTIWLRRWHEPWLPPVMHPGDQEVATRQCDRVLKDFLSALDKPGVFWVHHFEQDSTFLLKAFQLREAVRAGLTIPETVISNDPAEIREFIERCGGVAAHKLLQHAVWKSHDGETVFACYTSPVTVDDLPQDDTLRLSPAIFQTLLEKQFEIRVACFGDHLISLQIDSQTDEHARFDWRANQFKLQMKPYALPEEVAQAIRRFLHATGMTCTSLDFVVTPGGEHIFLEANPQGQFLWMEDRTGLPLLNAASEFFIAGSREFHPDPANPHVSLPQFLEVWEGGLKEAAQQHVLVNKTMSVPEEL